MPTSDLVFASGKAPDDVLQKVRAIQETYRGRDGRASAVRAVRRGDFDALNPELFTEDWPRPTVANLVDVYARDAASSMAPLPSFNCSTSVTLKPAAQDFADKRTKIANNYVVYSNLAAQQQGFADSFNSYALGVYRIQPDFDDMMPRIKVEDGTTMYVVWNQRLEVSIAIQKYKTDWLTLKEQFPKAAAMIQANRYGIIGGQVDVISYEDDKVCMAYVPQHGNIMLTSYANPIGRCSVVAVPRPQGSGNWQAGDLHGAYDDLIWPQMARHQLQMYAMEAAEKSVRAPLVVPLDAVDLPIGPDSVWRTNQGAGSVGRVQLDVPQSAFQAMQWLERDMQLGALVPESRSGQVNASVITGAGVNALNAGFSTQIAAAQTLFKLALKQAIELCFLWDEKVWPDKRKAIRGTDDGVPFAITYMPSKDIAGDHTIEIEYGFYAGLDPNRALIFILQALGAKLISTDTARRALPVGVIHPAEEEQKIEMEDLRASLMGSIAGMSQAIPAMAEQGADPSDIVHKIATVLKGLQDGKRLEDLAVQVFTPPAPPPAAPALPGAPAAPGDAAGALPAGPGAAAPGLPPGAAPGDRPALQELFAGLRPNGSANLSGGVAQQLAAR